jgi:hypothetical protein
MLEDIDIRDQGEDCRASHEGPKRPIFRTMRYRRALSPGFPVFFLLVLCAPRILAHDAAAGPLLSPEDEGRLAAFSDASQEWGSGVEGLIEQAYRNCFKTYIIGGRVLTLRMPFAQNKERSELAEGDLEVLGGGKADPAALWKDVDALFATEDFRAYVAALSDGRRKGISFDLGSRRWSPVLDRFYIERMESGEYPGLPNKPFVLASGRGPTVPDLYNYVYCVGRLGMDCSGFVWNALKAVARAGGLDLDRALRRAAGAPRSAQASLYVGTRFFDPRNKAVQEIADEVGKLRPGDVILFRGEDGEPLHSSIIQSVDLEAGRIRYLQSTDEAPLDERGVHESFILFDPARPEARLRDPELVWTQRREATFPGELLSAYRDDGERYRAIVGGGGTVVRVRALEKVVVRLSGTAPAKR